MRRRLRVLLAAFLVATSFVRLLGQTQGDNEPSKFDAASIKPVEFDSRDTIGFKFLPGRFVATNLTLAQLIQQAYGVEDRELAGGPDWVRADRFNITATTGGSVSGDRERTMLQMLLKERFRLALKHKTTIGTTYRLVSKTVHDLNAPTRPNGRAAIYTMREDSTGVLSYIYDGHNATMTTLANTLASHVRAPVTNDTGLTKAYDFKIHWAYDAPFFGLDPDPNIPTIFTALETQLGLKLEPTKGPVEVLVIDHVERPSEN